MSHVYERGNGKMCAYKIRTYNVRIKNKKKTQPSPTYTSFIVIVFNFSMCMYVDIDSFHIIYSIFKACGGVFLMEKFVIIIFLLFEMHTYSCEYG